MYILRVIGPRLRWRLCLLWVRIVARRYPYTLEFQIEKRGISPDLAIAITKLFSNPFEWSFWKRYHKLQAAKVEMYDLITLEVSGIYPKAIKRKYRILEHGKQITPESRS